MTLSAAKLLNHSLMSRRTKILDGSGLRVIATGALIDSLIPSSGPRSFGAVFLCLHCIASRAGRKKNDGNIQENMHLYCKLRSTA